MFTVYSTQHLSPLSIKHLLLLLLFIVYAINVSKFCLVQVNESALYFWYTLTALHTYFQHFTALHTYFWHVGCSLHSLVMDILELVHKLLQPRVEPKVKQQIQDFHGSE